MMGRRKPGYLDGQFLVALPGMEDPRFQRSVVFLCAHSEEGAMGIVVNAPMPQLTFRELLGQLKIIAEDASVPLPPSAEDIVVLQGGPVETGRGFVLHSPDFHAENSTLAIAEDVSLTATLDVLKAIARGEGPSDAIMALGYAGWGAGQLETELRGDAWITAPADRDLLFDTDLEAKHGRVLRRLGIEPGRLSATSGRA